MKLLVTTDAHFFKTPDNRVWCESIYQYSFWERYLTVFEKLRVVGRVKDVPSVNKKWLRVDGENVEIYGIPFFQGPKQLIVSYIKINSILKTAYDGCDAILYRMPSPCGQLVYGSKNIFTPYAVEVVYDPTDNLNMRNGIMYFITAIKFYIDLKRICKKANGVSYVTNSVLQKKFPSYSILHGESSEYFSSYYSTIQLNDNAFGTPKKYEASKKFIVAHSNVKMNSYRKGEITLLEAIKKVRNAGYDVEAIFIGDGNLRHTFEEKARTLEIDKYVQFTGLLPTADAVREKLLSSDIYVLPTSGEGLPRGIIEAMAAGLPCISSPVGGVPELIDSEFLFHYKDVEGYSNAIIKLLSNTETMEQISQLNIIKAKEYKNDILQERRESFYRKLYDLAVGS